MTDIRTERLLLRRWRTEDLDRLAVVFADERVWWYPMERGFTRDETERFIARRIAEWEQDGWGLWAAELDGNLIGYTGFGLPHFLPEVMPVPEIGWRLEPAYWGRGLATEAANAALEHGFTALGFSEVVSIYNPQNIASGRVMERIGMKVDCDTVHPELGHPVRVYRLGRDAWEQDRDL